MNQLKFPNGGISLEGDDFRFLTTGIIEALYGAVSAFQFGDTFILSGVEFTTGSPYVRWSAGYAVVNGEICKLDAYMGSALNYSSGYVYLEIAETYDPAGIEATELAGPTVDTYAVRKGNFVWYAAPQVGKILWNELKTLNNRWITLDTDWDEAATLGDALKRTRYRYASDGCLEVIFRLYNNPDTSGNIYSAIAELATFPIGFRPDRNHHFALFTNIINDTLNNRHSGKIHMSIMTDGKLNFNPLLGLDDAGTDTDQGIIGGTVWTGFIRIPLITA